MRKKLIFLVLSAVIILAPSSLFLQLFEAAELVNEDNAQESVVIDETIEDDLYVQADRSVSIETDVNGDVMVGAGNVTIRGDVNGDVFVAGGLIKIEGDVTGNVIGAGGQITIDGTITGIVILTGGDISLNTVNGNLLGAGGQITIDGPVSKSVRVAGGAITINGEVAGDVMASGGVVDINGDVGQDIYAGGGQVNINSAKVGRDIYFYGEEENLNISTQTIYGGTLEIEVVESYSVDISTVAPLFAKGGFTLGIFGVTLMIVITLLQTLGFILVGYLALKFAPLKMSLSAEKMSDLGELAKSFGIGLLLAVLALPVVSVLIVSVVGWQLLTVLVGIVMIIKVLSVPLAALVMGRGIMKIFGSKRNLVLPMVVGIMLLQIVSFAPCIGAIVMLLVNMTGIGAFTRMQYTAYNEVQVSIKQSRLEVAQVKEKVETNPDTTKKKKTKK